MMKKKKSRVIELKNQPSILGTGSCVGKNESEGPLGHEFDKCYKDDGIESSSWEKAESKLMSDAINFALDCASIQADNIDISFAGDLLNQCTASSYTFRELNVPFCGLFGACSTMAYSLALASLMVDGNFADYSLAATSSHFCSAEKQFRYPLEYGSQRPPCAQRTVTGAGAFIIGNHIAKNVFIPRVYIGKVIDAGITDTANMGAAMAPVDVKIEP